MHALWRFVAPLFGLMGARLAGAGFGFLSQLALARAFAPQEVGVAFLAISITTFVSLLITGGYHTIGLTYLARFHAFGRAGLVQSFLQAARRDMMALALLALVLASLAWFVPAAPGVPAAVFWGTLAAIPLAAIRLNNSTANAERRFTLSYAPDFVFRPLLLLVLIGALWLLGQTQTVWPVLVGLAVISLLVAVVQAWLLGKDNAWTLGGPIGRDLRPFYRKRALAMLAVTIVAGATADVVVMIGGFFVPPEEVAVLGVAVRIAALVSFFALASQQFVLRDLVTLRQGADRAAIDSLLLRTNLTGAAMMGAAMALMLVLGPFILDLFGPHYGSGYWAVQVFLLGQAVRVLGGMNAQLLALGGHQVRSAMLCVLALLLLVATSAALAPVLGIMGIALGALAAELFWAIGLAVLVQRLEGRRGDLIASLAHIKY